MVDISEDALKLNLQSSGIPRYMWGGLIRYIINRVEPGGFLVAVLSNDLRRAFEKADDNNQHALFNYVKFLYNYAPSDCWGSPENVRDWLSKRTL